MIVQKDENNYFSKKIVIINKKHFSNKIKNNFSHNI